MRIAPLAVIAGILFCPIVAAQADTGTVQNITTEPVDRVDITTLSGVDYTNCKVTRVEPNGITVLYAKGIAKIPFTELPEELRAKYNYNSTNAAAYTRTMSRKQAEAWAREQARQQEVAAAAAAARQQEEDTALLKKAAEAKRQALAALSQQARQGKAFTSDCRILVGCTKETVSSTLGAPSMTISSGSTWVYYNFVDPESGRYNSVHVNFSTADIVERVFW